MKSKEALDNLYQGSLNPENCLYATFRFRTDAGNKITNDYKVVKKDLQVLALLKSQIVSKDGTTTTFDTRDYRIKEWLEND